ncbi:hypothetical protein AQUCO_02600223v1 [Aquilegia coerulea]|uniref:Uncharacterized protein n=1 Tax=Aquilegia coerulea TaxID=218851 RepID=A0A2G5D807_AQUCA|nr:hypothetical protein AQUCO_02600223v1 [Aquilegia coerulea]
MGSLGVQKPDIFQEFLVGWDFLLCRGSRRVRYYLSITPCKILHSTHIKVLIVFQSLKAAPKTGFHQAEP